MDYVTRAPLNRLGQACGEETPQQDLVRGRLLLHKILPTLQTCEHIPLSMDQQKKGNSG